MSPTPLATVLLDPPTTLMVGAIVALVSMKLIARGGLGELQRGVGYALGWAVMYALSVGWHFFYRPDWMLVYLVDAQRVPLVPAYVGFLFVCAGFGVMGYLGVGVLLHLGKRALAWAVALSAVASLGLCQLLTASQYAKVGTWQQYQAGTALAMADDQAIVTAWLVAGGLIAAWSIGLLVVLIRRIRAPA